MSKKHRKKTEKRAISPAPVVVRAYDGARPTRLTGEPPLTTSSADTELAMNLAALRNRCRALVRNNAYAKRLRRLVQDNVVGMGIGLQAAITFRNGKYADRLNDPIEAAWREWCRADQCHTAGRLHFSDLERLLIGEVFEAGEVLVRLHRRAFGDSRVPLALEIIEAERIADDQQIPAVQPGHTVRLGVEQDAWGRPVAYWVHGTFPGEYRVDWARASRLERVPADDILHLHLIDRWPQSRGEPWLHSVIRKLQDIGAYTSAEIEAASAAAMYVGFIKSDTEPVPANTTGSSSGTMPDWVASDPRWQGGSDTRFIDIAPGEIKHLNPAESFEAWNPNRPNSQADPFLRLMLREVAVGAGPSYEATTGDYSQTNYSSSRLASLVERDHWRTLQQWFIRAFREPLHRVWVNQAATFGALPAEHFELLQIDPARVLAARWKPRGWSWVDPTKEVEAYRQAELAGYCTKGDIIAATAGGLDLEDVMKARKQELEMIESLGLAFETGPMAEQPEPEPEPTPEPDATDDDEAPQRAALTRVK
jgi:lambda family phage portal protein